MGDKVKERPKSFEEFYFSGDGEIYDIENVIYYVLSNNNSTDYYDGKMFCPECQNAELHFVRKTSKKRAFLRRNSSSKHEDICSYNFEYTSKKIANEFIKNLDKAQMQDRLESALNMLFKKKKNENNNSNNTKKNRLPQENPALIEKRKENSTIFYALRRKKLNKWIDESDGTELQLFYGKVKLQVVENEKTNENGEKYYFYYLKIFTKNKSGGWSWRTDIYRGGNKDSVNPENIYQIVMIGHLDFSRKYWTINLKKNQHAVRFREII